jgi:hypothetical protein
MFWKDKGKKINEMQTSLVIQTTMTQTLQPNIQLK